VYCFDTDVWSDRRDPPLHPIRRLARTPRAEQCTTGITLGELVHGVNKRGSPQLAERVGELIASAGPILPFDENAARRY
jgi:predicted nucleic acid-binding protein